MKTLLFCFLCLLSTIQLLGKCGPGDVNVWPRTSHIQANHQLFIINLYGTHTDLSSSLGKDQSKVYLLSGKERIGLQVKEVLTGDFRVAQVVLELNETLTIGKTYKLHVENTQKFGTLFKERYNSSTHKQEPIQWTVLPNYDVTKPSWTKAVTYADSRYEQLGCGPINEVLFDNKVKEQNMFLIKAQVKNTLTGKVKYYYLEQSANHQLSIGHSMCSGPFRLVSQQKYEAVFQLVDGAGNWSEPSKAISFLSAG